MAPKVRKAACLGLDARHATAAPRLYGAKCQYIYGMKCVFVCIDVIDIHYTLSLYVYIYIYDTYIHIISTRYIVVGSNHVRPIHCSFFILFWGTWRRLLVSKWVADASKLGISKSFKHQFIISSFYPGLLFQPSHGNLSRDMLWFSLYHACRDIYLCIYSVCTNMYIYIYHICTHVCILIIYIYTHVYVCLYS